MLNLSEILKLKRWNTPTICNGWEQITNHHTGGNEGFNIEETTDFMPQMGPMVGYTVTLKIEPGKKVHKSKKNAWAEYREYISSLPGPKIVIVQDLDKPFTYGSFWGEVNSNVHRALGCVGTITDGSIRDVDEMTNAGFKALARRLSVSHAFSAPVEWNCEVEVFGRKIKPGQLIHADKHGFIVIPQEDEEKLLEAAIFMDNNECNTIIAAARNAVGKSTTEILKSLNEASVEFKRAAKEKFGSKG